MNKKRILLGLALIICLIFVGGAIVQSIWNGKSTDEKLSYIINNTVDNKKVFDMVVHIESADGTFSYKNSAGSMDENSQFAIASITKLYTAAIIYNLIDAGQLSLEDTIDTFFDRNVIDQLHRYKENDYSTTITIGQLLSQTSGLPDYFTEKNKDGLTYLEELSEKDAPISFEEILNRSKQLDAHFINGTKGKAYYADLNFDLLGEIAEKVSGETLETLYDTYIIQPLKLESTYLGKPDSRFAPIYMGKKQLHRPIAISSFRASGGIISNTTDLMTFLKAFYKGELFSPSNIENPTWNKIQFFPLQYGNGMMRVKMNRLMSPFFPAPELLGHSGSTGSFAFYSPAKDVYIVGTINQIEKNPFQMIYLMLNSVN